MYELPWIKSLANRFRGDPKIVIHGNECIILFLTRYFMSWTHNSAKNKSSIAHFVIVAKDTFWHSILTSPQLIRDVTRTWDTGIVTSYSSIVFACANWRRNDLQQWITTVNIDFSPLAIHGLACKKLIYLHTDRLCIHAIQTSHFGTRDKLIKVVVFYTYENQGDFISATLYHRKYIVM